jgi:predicted Zn-dependent peptidase
MSNLLVLSNGLKIVVDPIKTVETVSIGVWVKIGTRNEPAQVNGISHFLEHMAFKGTASRSARQIVEDIEAVGGYINAFTSREMTSYQARILKDNFPLALDILSDILLNSVFDESEFQRERDVIYQEILESHDAPDDIVFDYFQELLFPNQPLGRPVLGTPETLSSMTTDALRAYMSSHYAPHNIVISVAGNVDPDAVFHSVQNAFSSLKDFDTPLPEKADYAGGIYSYVKPIEQTQWLLGFPGVSNRDPQFYTSAVLTTLVGGGMSSRLFQEIRENLGLAYSTYAYHSCYQDTGVFALYSSTSPEKTMELTQKTLHLLQDLPSSMTLQEVERSKTQLKAGILMGLESTTGRSDRAAQQLLIHEKLTSSLDIIAKVDAITLADVKAFAEKTLHGPMTCVTLGPNSLQDELAELLKK